ncbi:hypothetical protein Adt_28435 [Abeliophyllum distichum]|uniref:Uncharacterized protein n=1 Tax=Abeliophyllum distichum TaxID=126358 RepID=A0ABD1RWI8_9LAMI
MNRFRKNLEQVYESSQGLGLLNVLLAFEDNELDKIVSIVKNIDIGKEEEIILIAKYVGDEPNNLKPIRKIQTFDSDSNNSSEEDVIIHERFFASVEPIKGVETT